MICEVIVDDIKYKVVVNNFDKREATIINILGTTRTKKEGKLLSIDFPGFVTIEGYVFTVIRIDLTSTSIPTICHSIGKINIPNQVIRLSNYCFSGFSSLRKVKIGSGINKINHYCFYNCKDLRKVILGENIECIETYAFNNCFKLEDINLQDTKLKEIQYKSFYECGSLKKIIIPKTVEYVSSYSFIGCRSLLGNIIFKGPIPKSERKGVYYNIFPKHMDRKYNTIYVQPEYAEDFLNDDGFRSTEIIIEGQNDFELDIKEGKAIISMKLDKSGGNNYNGDIVVMKSVIIDRKIIKVSEVSDFSFSQCSELKSVLLPKDIIIDPELAFLGTNCKIDYY